MAELLQRLLNFSFSLANGTSFSVSGLRASCRINKAGGLQMAQSEIDIYGIPLNGPTSMNQLSTLGLNLQAGTLLGRNVVTIAAGDSSGATAQVYQGEIMSAYADLNSMPNVALKLGCVNGGYFAMQQAQPASYKGLVSAVQILSDIAAKMGVGFDASLVNTDKYISNHNSPDSLIGQMQQVASAANLDVMLDDDIMVVANQGAARPEAAIPVNASTGMIGSPAIATYGIMVRTLFNPAIKRLSQVQVTSQILPQSQLNKISAAVNTTATGTWYVYSMDHALDSMIPNGKWESTLLCALPGQLAQAPS